VTQQHGAAIGILIAINAILIQALATDLFFLSPKLKGSNHGGDADKEGDGAEVAAIYPSLKKEVYPYCSANHHHNENDGELRAVRKPVAGVQEDEDSEETYGQP
jgi:hypothetical protein